jgi:hypothetical protein
MSAEPSPALRARIRQAVAEDGGVDHAGGWRRFGWAAALAAGVFAAAALAALWRASSGVREDQTAVAPLRAPQAAPPVTERRESRSLEPPQGDLAMAGRLGPPARTTPPVRAPRWPEPEVLVPAGQQEALLEFVTVIHRERLTPAALAAVGETSADLREPRPIDIQPLEIVPLDPAGDSGT